MAVNTSWKLRVHWLAPSWITRRYRPLEVRQQISGLVGGLGALGLVVIPAEVRDPGVEFEEEDHLVC